MSHTAGILPGVKPRVGHIQYSPMGVDAGSSEEDWMRRSMASVAMASVAIGVGCLLTAGCSRTEEPAKPPEAAAKEPGAGLPEESAKAPVIETGTELPGDFPKQAVPLPAGGKLVTFVADGQGDDRAWTLQIEVADAKQAAEAYRAALKQAGFVIAGEYSMKNDAGTVDSFEATSNVWDVSVLASKPPDAERDVVVMAVAKAQATDPADSGADDPEEDE